MMDSAGLRRALLADREASFFRLRGGYPVPLAGATWWAMLGVAGYVLHSRGQVSASADARWIMLAFVTSGAIFPLAVLYGRLFKNNFMRDKTAVSDLLWPGLTSMVLFWPIAISAFWTYPQLVPLVLAVGMSTFWPVVGWMYGRTAIFTAHAVVRAVVCFVLWNWVPSSRFTVMPLFVSALYLVTVGVTFVASSPARQKVRLEDVTAG